MAVIVCTMAKEDRQTMLMSLVCCCRPNWNGHCYHVLSKRHALRYHVQSNRNGHCYHDQSSLSCHCGIDHLDHWNKCEQLPSSPHRCRDDDPNGQMLTVERIRLGNQHWLSVQRGLYLSMVPLLVGHCMK